MEKVGKYYFHKMESAQNIILGRRLRKPEKARMQGRENVNSCGIICF